jgi:hypothetical protein
MECGIFDISATESPLQVTVLEPHNLIMDRTRRNAKVIAGVLSVLYLALLLCTPWVIRESTLLLPTSAFASAQGASVAAAVAIEKLGHGFRARL